MEKMETSKNEVDITNKCQYFSNTLEDTIDGMLESTTDYNEAFQSMLSLSYHSYVPPPALINRCFKILINSRDKTLSLKIFSTLKQIQTCHPYNCCNKLWRGVSRDGYGTSTDQIKELKLDALLSTLKLQPNTPTEQMKQYNTILLLKYVLDFFEEENKIHVPTQEQSLFIYMKKNHASRQNKEEIVRLIADVFVISFNIEVQLLIQKLLHLMLRIYYDGIEDYHEKEDMITFLMNAMSTFTYADTKQFLETFVHQSVKGHLIDRILYAHCDISDVVDANILEKQQIGIEKFIHFFYVLKPPRTAARAAKKQKKNLTLEMFILYQAHLLQSFIATLARNPKPIEEKMKKKLVKRTFKFCQKLREEISSVNEHEATLLEMMEFFIKCFN